MRFPQLFSAIVLTTAFCAFVTPSAIAAWEVPDTLKYTGKGNTDCVAHYTMDNKHLKGRYCLGTKAYKVLAPTVIDGVTLPKGETVYGVRRYKKLVRKDSQTTWVHKPRYKAILMHTPNGGYIGKKTNSLKELGRFREARKLLLMDPYSTPKKTVIARKQLSLENSYRYGGYREFPRHHLAV